MLKKMTFAARLQVSKFRNRHRHHAPKRPLALFAQHLLKNPRAIGAICPSSSYLARAMANQLPHDNTGLVVELGGGTGNISAALLNQGLPAKRLVILERAPELASYLNQRFPLARVLQGDAAALQALLGKDCNNVQAIISGLPLRALPHDLVNAILQQAHSILPKNGIYVQFTYDLRGQAKEMQNKGFERYYSRVVWRNIPPARVECFRKIKL